LFFSARGREALRGARKGAQQVPKFVDAESGEGLSEAVAFSKPNIVVNCIAVTSVSQHMTETGLQRLTQINGVFPHRLATVCQQEGIYLIHFSTDAVFSGRRGDYSELDRPDATDAYGSSKLRGEVYGTGTLTLRTSLYGSTPWKPGLVDWLVSRKGGVVAGYENYFFNGLSLPTLRRVLECVVNVRQRPQGLFHLGTTKVSKFALLEALSRELTLGVLVQRHAHPIADRTLLPAKLFATLDVPIPTWDSSAHELVAEMSRLPQLGSNGQQ
jgi:dTDP-4-dehydrorhamnose reductase